MTPRPATLLRLTLACLAVLVALPASFASAAPSPAEGPEFVPGEVVVRFAAASDASQRQQTMRLLGTRANEAVSGVPGTRVLTLAPGEDTEDAVRRLEARSDVAWAEPNYLLSLQQLPNDPRLGMQWGIRNLGQNVMQLEGAEPVFGTPGIDVAASAAWDVTTGGGGRVAIVDSGVSPNHPDLVPNLNSALSRNFVATHSLDPEPPVDPNAWADVHGHGTHVAGIVGAVGNNGLGVAGVNWRTEMVAVRVCSETGFCESADVAAGLAYAGAIGAQVANVSLGADNDGREILNVMREAIASHPGTLYVAAAGNGDELGRPVDVDANPQFPCAFDVPNILCVAALAPDGEMAPFSNYGLRTVHLGAPGHFVDSTYVRHGEILDEYMDEGLWRWDQAPYDWREGEFDGEPAMVFDGIDGELPSPVGTATAFLAEELDLSGMRSCWAKLDLQLELHGNQTFAIEAGSAGDMAPMPPRVYDSSTPTEPFETAAYLGAVDGLDEVGFGFRFEANGSTSMLPDVRIGSVVIECVGPMPPTGAYRPLSGTSMATPYVAGVASLGRSVQPGVGTAALRQAVLATTVPTPSLAGKTVTGGRVDAARLIEALRPAPPPAPAAKARLAKLRVTPKRLALAPGRGGPLTVQVRNEGNAAAQQVRVCLQAPARFVRGARCIKPRRIAAGANARIRFWVKPKPRAKRGATYTLRLRSQARGLPTDRATVPLRIRAR